MNREEINSLEQALKFIDELESQGTTHKLQVEGLTEKCNSFENENKALKDEVAELKKQVYDYWMQIPRDDGNKVINDNNQNESKVRSLDELLNN